MSFRPYEGHGRVGVVDIGSNSVRLVVYDAPTRLPIPMYNEKAQCGLGRGMGATGMLHPQGYECALSTVKRFAGLAEAMGVEDLELVATAAVRDATDGPEFIKDVHDAIARDIQVLSGEDEAKYAALGLLMGVPQADGSIKPAESVLSRRRLRWATCDWPKPRKAIPNAPASLSTKPCRTCLG